MLEILILSAAFIVAVAIFFIGRRKSNKGIPAAGGGLPIFGHVFTLLKGSAWDQFATWVQTYGTIYSVSIFGSKMICVSDPAMLKVILQTKLNSFTKDREWTYKPFLVLLGNGLVTSHGKNWLRQRTVLANHFKKDILTDIPLTSINAVYRLIERLTTHQEQGTVVEMAEEFRHLTLQVIAEVILSLSPQESDQTFAKMYLPIVEEGNLRIWQPWRMYLPLPAWFKFRSDVKRLDTYMTGLMEKRRVLRAQKAPKQHQDVLDKMLIALDQDVDAKWDQDTIIQFRDELKTFVLAGHETSAAMLAWTLYELTLPSNSGYLERVLSEAKVVFCGEFDPSKGKRLTTSPPRDQLDKLIFAECCLRESLRKYSVVPTVVRVAAEDVTLAEDVEVVKGSTLMVCMQGVHHNPDIWVDPLQYRPERFLLQKGEDLPPFTFLPFIEGPRMCLGQYLSLLESKIVLSLLLMHFEFDLQNPNEAGRKHPFMVPIIPETGHFLKPVAKIPLPPPPAVAATAGNGGTH